MIEGEILNCGYEKSGRNRWIRGDRVIRLARSSEFGPLIRIRWREEWKSNYAIIYDYSRGGGPVCIVPVHDLFTSAFVRKKRNMDSYANSGYWWSQLLPADHALVGLVLSFQELWDFLKE